jgi:ubiquinone/menaquinone biosynthesis C-methylase UbiE
MELFFEIHRDLPREGPGDFVSTRRAFTLLSELPQKPQILDIGCGPGMQTLHLAQLTDGEISAVDKYQPYLEQLILRARDHRVAGRIHVVNADMKLLPFEETSFDVIWSEGSAYLLGFEKALRTWRPLLKPNGFLAVTELSWLQSQLPEQLRSFWESEYPAITGVNENIAICGNSGYTVLGHFVLPEVAWWDHYYYPLKERLQLLRQKYESDPERMDYIKVEEYEIELYGAYSDFYGYVFYVMQVDSAGEE